MREVHHAVKALLKHEAHHAIKYTSPRFVVRATRVLYGGRIDRRAKTIEVRIRIGQPNYAEREFIRDCIAAGVPFPVRNVQLIYPPQRRQRQRKR